MDVEKGIYGEPILEDGMALMEVKTADSIPLWFADILSELKIYKTSFSKYGNAYKTICEREKRKLVGEETGKMETLFRGIFDSSSQAVIGVGDFLLCVLVALCIGAFLAFVYSY